MTRASRCRVAAVRCLGVAAAVTTLGISACGSPETPPAIATSQPAQGGTPTPSPAPIGISGTRTVLSPLGLNIHSGPQLSAAVLGTAAAGTTLTVADRNDQNGGWFKVQGQTVTGWIVADPSLTAPGLFTAYQSSDRLFNVLYPQGWTFAEEVADVLFHPVAGPQTIVARTAAHVADFGSPGGPGFVGAGQQTVVVCGVTGNLNEFTRAGTAPATPAPGTAGPLALLAQIRLTLDASHALALDYNYTTKADLQQFSDFYNSMTFPFPQCQAPAATTPSPSPT